MQSGYFHGLFNRSLFSVVNKDCSFNRVIVSSLIPFVSTDSNLWNVSCWQINEGKLSYSDDYHK